MSDKTDTPNTPKSPTPKQEKPSITLAVPDGMDPQVYAKHVQATIAAQKVILLKQKAEAESVKRLHKKFAAEFLAIRKEEYAKRGLDSSRLRANES